MRISMRDITRLAALAIALSALASCGGSGGCDEDFSSFVRNLIFNQTTEDTTPVEVGGTDFCGESPEDNVGEFDDLFS